MVFINIHKHAPVSMYRDGFSKEDIDEVICMISNRIDRNKHRESVSLYMEELKQLFIYV